MQSDNSDTPHSVAFWFHWEIHDRKSNGQLSGSAKKRKDYNGVLHCKDMKNAEEVINSIVNNLTEYLKECHTKLNQQTE